MSRLFLAMDVFLRTVSMPTLWLATWNRSKGASGPVACWRARPIPICFGVSFRLFDTAYTKSSAILHTVCLVLGSSLIPPPLQLFLKRATSENDTGYL